MKNDSASSTAFTVVQGILHIARSTDYPGGQLVSDSVSQFCENLLHSSEEGRRRLRQMSTSWGYRLLLLKEKLLMPGISLHYALRKRYIEDYISAQLEQGCTQVINLGAGFDSLLYRLSQEYPHVNLIEVDHPATQAVKVDAFQQILAKTNTTMPENLHFLPVEFESQEVQTALQSSECFNVDRPTVYIFEGVLPYLNPETVVRNFQALKSLGHPTFSVIFSAVVPLSKHLKSFGVLFNLYLKLKGEPLNWMCETESLPGFFKTFGFKILDTCDAEGFKRNYLPENFNGPMQVVEYMAVAVPD
ncbi:methyltransferase [Oleiphilus messinensis]|uniref:S-adenosyl-L-methionine-dependent methyltransferase n=1 Tax=Oleiphilus messinensis TaxID=141451 RepID=A0A1Y0I7L5_9GAMM|nr:class I SAM-dependent methyltransferase [Oleiphilus messinensis]ARU55393.1 methyltransferase [Oleiphilus messinensis]